MNPQPGLDRFWKLGLGLFVWGGVVWMALQVEDYLLPIVALFGVALLLTYILLPPVNLLDRALNRGMLAIPAVETLPRMRWLGTRGFSRILAIAFVYLSFGITLTLAGFKLLPLASEQLYQFGNQLPRYINQAEDWVVGQPYASRFFQGQLRQLNDAHEISLDDQWQIHLEKARRRHEPGKVQRRLTPTEQQLIKDKVLGRAIAVDEIWRGHINNSLNNVFTVVSTTISGLVYALTALVVMFYFLMDGMILKEGFVRLLPSEAQPAANSILSSIHNVMYGFVKGQVLLGIATGVYMFIIYTIFGVPYAFFLSTFFAIAEVIPVVGTWLGFSPGILVLLFSHPVQLLPVAALLYAYQTLKDNIVAPRVMGSVLGLHPVIVIISLLLSARVAGFVGIIFAIPLASVINVLIHFVQTRNLYTPGRATPT